MVEYISLNQNSTLSRTTGPRQSKIMRQLLMLNYAVSMLSSNLSLRHILDTVASEITALFAADGCVLRKWDESSNNMVFMAGKGSGRWMDETCMREFNLIGTPLESVVTGKMVLQLNNDSQVNKNTKEWLSHFQAKSIMLVPLIFQETTLGVIEIYNLEQIHYDIYDVILVNLFAGHVAIALENASLYGRARREMDNRIKLEERLRHDTFHDTLTGLPKRSIFQDRLERAILRKRQNPEFSFVVIFIDLDNFKEINDNYGYAVGDEVLEKVANKLITSVRDIDTVCRFGGDKFLILLESKVDELSVKEYVTRIQEILKTPININQDNVIVTASLGIVTSSDMRNNPEDYIRDAELAMHKAKNKGNGVYQLFHKEIRHEMEHRATVENEMRQALSGNEFLIFYQPVVSLDSRSITGLEALARWQHPERGLILPDHFIPIAEKSGMIVDIGYFLIENIFQTMMRWQNENGHHQPDTISFNVSGKQLCQKGFVGQLKKTILKNKLDPHRLALEVTESVFIEEMDNVSSAMIKLNELGIKIYLDDFGTGYSSLGYINQLPIHAIKLHHSFISDILNNLKQQTLVSTIVSMANNIGLDVIAEGIETKEQANWLHDLGCKFGQGFLYYPALGPDKVKQLLAKME